MEIKLHLQKGASQLRTFRMTRDVMVIGRLAGCALRIPSASVSRAHCRLSFSAGILKVEDLGSANGTFLNGQLVQQGVVRPGDQLTVGPVTFRVEYPLTPASLDRLLATDDLVPLEEAPAAALSESVVDAIPLDDMDDTATVQEIARKPSPVDLTQDPDAALAALAELDAPAEKPPRKPKKKKKKRKKDEQEENPDYSAMMEQGGAWQMPADQDIRGLLSQLEDEDA